VRAALIHALVPVSRAETVVPQRAAHRLFTLASIGGVTLGVAVLIIVLSVMNGFGDEIRQKILETNGDVDVRSEGASCTTRRR